MNRYKINQDWYNATQGTQFPGRSYAWVANSLHPGGAQFCMGDGSTRFLSQSLDLYTWLRLNYSHDGEPIMEEW